MTDRLRPTQISDYNYSRLIASAKEESKYRDFSSFMDEKIQNIREKYYYGEAHRFTRSTLAEIVGIDSSTLTKIINGRQATRKRDIIIALCFALKLSPKDANIALNLYSMAPLNRCNLRDLVIEHALGDGLSIPELNDILETQRMHRLNVLRNKEKEEDQKYYYPYESTAYDEVSIDIYPYCIAGDDAQRSLHERYRTDQFIYHCEMIVRPKKAKDLEYLITLNGGDCYEISIRDHGKWKLLYSDDKFIQDHEDVKTCGDADLLNEKTKLIEYRDRRARYVHNMCSDTRNYGVRMDAVNDQGRIVIYGETFGYDVPELCEYYQIEVSCDGCVFTISNTSRFMERYLGTEQWMKMYGMTLPPVNQSFSSLEDVPSERMRNHFRMLLDAARDLLDQIRQRKLFLFNAHAWIEIDDLMHYYHVEDAFDCVVPDPEEAAYSIIPQKERIVGPDGRYITIDDLYKAMELEISSIEDLCEIRTRYGSIEQFLHIDLLDEQKGK